MAGKIYKKKKKRKSTTIGRLPLPLFFWSEILVFELFQCLKISCEVSKECTKKNTTHCKKQKNDKERKKTEIQA